jgi:hypothetical protein
VELLVFLLLIVLGVFALGAAVKLVFGLVLQILLLPVKLLGLAFKVVFGIFGVAAKLLFSVAGLAVGVVCAVLALVLVPLLPFLLVGGLVWLIARRPRPHAILRHTA